MVLVMGVEPTWNLIRQILSLQRLTNFATPAYMIVLFIYKAPLNYQKGAVAAGTGFEPAMRSSRMTVFKTAAINHSAILLYGVGEGVRFPNATLEEWSVANYTTPTYWSRQTDLNPNLLITNQLRYRLRHTSILLVHLRGNVDQASL